MRRVEVPLDPVVGGTEAVLLQERPVGGILLVQLRTFQHDFADPMHLRTMGIFLGLHRRVMLAMHRGPLAGVHTTGQP